VPLVDANFAESDPLHEGAEAAKAAGLWKLLSDARPSNACAACSLVGVQHVGAQQSAREACLTSAVTRLLVGQHDGAQQLIVPSFLNSPMNYTEAASTAV
jgi:hypothetical protein